jgi:hypothetical protein
MFLPIPIGYFVAVFLMVSGVLNCVEFLKTHEEFSSRAEMLNGLACSGWGIIAASVILLLIQINKQLESIRFAAADTTPTPTKIKKAKAAQTEKPGSAVPQNNLRQIYPNSPIPGGNRAPQAPVAPPIPQPEKSEPGKLNYFKVD